ncbi:hypothetical protein GA0061094_3824 [[Bacillus] enclensis]|uniref:Uncharacterized protein n=1 Tax=[Bacillus] enclensis TaxID=1402860 RepID=A0A1C4DFX9_9BACI|nr:hypothetical protein GA0061094_3824 [[Bacillus] enclensis]
MKFEDYSAEFKDYCQELKEKVQFSKDYGAILKDSPNSLRSAGCIIGLLEPKR